jgi:hypothetical protein
VNEKWKQVAQSDFETLTKYHNGEIRYYVDFNSAHRKSTGITAATRPKRAYKSRANRHPKVVGQASKSLLALDTNGKEFGEDTNIAKMATAVVKIFGSNASYRYPRDTVVRSLMRETGFGVHQVQPGITDLLKYGHLKYVGDNQPELPLSHSKSEQKRLATQIAGRGIAGQTGISKPRDLPLSLTTKTREEHMQGTCADIVQRAVYAVFENDPTNVIRRMTLVKQVVDVTPDAYGKTQVSPHISKMIQTGQIRPRV